MPRKEEHNLSFFKFSIFYTISTSASSLKARLCAALNLTTPTASTLKAVPRKQPQLHGLG
jgi:hypothetical protein